MAIKNPTPKQTQPEESMAPKRLQLLFTIVNRKKAEFYADFLQSFEVNMQLTLAASGTAAFSVFPIRKKALLSAL